MDLAGLSRRALLAGGAASPLAACATGFGPLSPKLQINLAGAPELPPPPPGVEAPIDPGASLQAGFDPVQRMTVPVRIDGAGPFTFVVDTGANHTALASEVAAGLNLPSAGRAMIHGIAGAEPAQTVTARRITIGEAVTKRMRMPLLPRSALGADGLLGVDALTRRHVSLDFEQNKFNIAASDETFTKALSHGPGGRLRSTAIDPSVVVVPARYRFGQLTIVDAEVGVGLPVTAFLDSGAQSTVGNLALREAAYRQDTGLALRVTRVQLVGATGQTVTGDLARLPSLRLGGLRIGNLSCVFADLHTFRIWDLIDQPAILIGMDVMRHFKAIELDFARRQVVFRAPQPSVARGPVG